MRNRMRTTLMAVAMIGTMALTGCASGNKPAPAAEQPKAAAADTKPPLEVPKSFSNSDEKRTFAFDAINKDYYKEAEPLLADIVKENPNDAVAQANLGTAKFMLNRFDEAIAAWSKVAELDPTKAAEMQNNIGNALRDTKKLPEAVIAYNEALKLDPTLWSAAVNLADVLKQQGKLDDAIKVLDASAVHNPKKQGLVAMAKAYKAEAAAKANQSTATN